MNPSDTSRIVRWIYQSLRIDWRTLPSNVNVVHVVINSFCILHRYWWYSRKKWIRNAEKEKTLALVFRCTVGSWELDSEGVDNIRILAYVDMLFECTVKNLHVTTWQHALKICGILHMYIHLRNHSESCYFFGTAKHNLTARDLGEVTTNVVYLDTREKANVEKSIDLLSIRVHIRLRT